MKILIISDVHSNWPALKAMEQNASYADFVIHAGDSIGYYPFPNECVNWLKEHADVNVMGNHDNALVNMDFKGFSEASQIMLNWTDQNINATNLKYLSNLKDTWTGEIEGIKIGVVHGGLTDHYNEFLHANSDEKIINNYLTQLNADILITGHVHQMFVRQLNNKLHINPGSIGQPRDYNPNPSYITLEVNNGKIESIKPTRFKYDYKPIEDKMKKEMLPLNFIEKLKNGY